MNPSDPQKADGDEAWLFRAYPTPFELANVAAVLSLREDVKDDPDQLFEEALKLLRGAKQKLIDDKAAHEKRLATEEAEKRKERQPYLLFEPSVFPDEVRDYLQKPRAKGGWALKNFRKASTFKRKFLDYCADVETILRMEKNDRGKFAKEFLTPDREVGPLRKAYRVPKAELDCFGHWWSEIEQMEASVRGGHPPSAVEILARISGAVTKGKRKEPITKLKEVLAEQAHPGAEERASKFITELRSLAPLNQRRDRAAEAISAKSAEDSPVNGEP